MPINVPSTNILSKWPAEKNNTLIVIANTTGIFSFNLCNKYPLHINSSIKLWIKYPNKYNTKNNQSILLFIPLNLIAPHINNGIIINDNDTIPINIPFKKILIFLSNPILFNSILFIFLVNNINNNIVIK